MTIRNLIASANTRLTPTERRIAEVVLADPMLLTFGTVSDVANIVGTSRPSIVRFATKLGYDGFTELQQHARNELASKVTSPSHRVRQVVYPKAQANIQEAVQKAFDVLTEETLVAMATPIVNASHVWILSGETSMAGAHVLQSGLSMTRANVRLVEEHAIGRELCGADKGDVAVVYDFSRYRRSSTRAAQLLHSYGVQIVVITDSPLSPLAELTEIRCELSIPAVGPFDSAIPAVVTSELLVAEVVHQMKDKARDRIDRLESFWEGTDTFLKYSSREER